MATIEMLSRREYAAMNRLQELKAEFSEKAGIEFEEMPKVKTMDAMLRRVVQLEHLSDTLSRIAQRMFGVDEQGLKENSPTLEEYVAAGYLAANYPPEGYTARPSLQEDVLEVTTDAAPELAEDVVEIEGAPEVVEAAVEKLEEPTTPPQPEPTRRSRASRR